MECTLLPTLCGEHLMPTQGWIFIAVNETLSSYFWISSSFPFLLRSSQALWKGTRGVSISKASGNTNERYSHTDSRQTPPFATGSRELGMRNVMNCPSVTLLLVSQVTQTWLCSGNKETLPSPFPPYI